MVDTEHRTVAVPAQQVQPVHNLQTLSLNLSMWKLGKAEMKGLPCSPTTHCIMRLPHYQGHLPQQRTVDLGALLTSYFTAPQPPHPFLSSISSRAQNYSFPARVAMELITMAAKGLANSDLHNCLVES